MFSIIIPTFNRLSNLRLMLASLEAQKDAPFYEIIIADDGSTDGTGDWIRNIKANYDNDKIRLIYQWCGPNLGFRTSRTRNIGIAQANFEWLIILDSDIMLNPNALRYHALLREAHKDLVVIGMYHWANKGTLIPEQVIDNFDYVMKLVPDELSKAPPTAGLDVRKDGFHSTFDESNIITEYDGLGFWSGNISWPTELWWTVGGQDEQMPNGMGEDAELGQRMRLLKLPVLQYEPIWGVHYSHYRYVAARQKMVQESIAYIDEKYSIGTYAEITDKETDPRELDLSLWYTRKQKARLVKFANDPTVYAIDFTESHYVGIPAPFWIDLLGFSVLDVEIVEQDYFDDIKYKGTIRK